MAKDLKTILQAFSGATLQSVSQVRKKLRKHGISWAEFDGWIESRNYYETKPKILPCPECGKSAALHEVNTKPCNQQDGDWKSMWMCDACGWNQLNLETTEEQAKLVKGLKPKSKKRKGRIIHPNEYRMLYYERRRIK